MLAGEECDGDDLSGLTCEHLGFDTGVLSCGEGCVYDTSSCYILPSVPVLELGFSQVRVFDFSWPVVPEAEYYQLFEISSPGDLPAQLGGDIVGQSISREMSLSSRYGTKYFLRACSGGDCTDSPTVGVVGTLARAVGYFKASNTQAGDSFGISIALSADGSTLAMSATGEDSVSSGVGGDQTSNSASSSAPGSPSGALRWRTVR